MCNDRLISYACGMHKKRTYIYIYIHIFLYVHIICLCIHSPLCRFSLYCQTFSPTTRDVFHSYPVDSSTEKSTGALISAF